MFQEGDFWALKGGNLESYLVSEKDPQGVINNSTAGQLVRSEYILEVFATMEGCFATTPHISTPVSIFFPDYKILAVTAPPGWSPQVMQLKTLQLAPEFMVSSGIGNVQVNMNLGGMTMGTTMTGGGMQVNNGGMQMNTQMTGMPGAQVTMTTTSSSNNTTVQENVKMDFGGINMTVSDTVSY